MVTVTGNGAVRVRTALREVLPGRDTPVTSLTLIVLLVTTLVLRFGVRSDIGALEWASTNIINLQTHPVRALFASIFVTSGWGAAVGIVLALTGPALERRAGHLRVLLIPLVAHIVATLATEGGLRAAIWAHSTPTSHAFQLDIGTSYVAYAAWGALLRYIPRRWRALYAVVLAGCTLIPLAIMRDMVGWGHLASAVIGLLSWHWLPDPADRIVAAATRPPLRRRRLRLPRGAFAFTSRAAWLAMIVAVTFGGAVLLYSGSQLLPAA